MNNKIAIISSYQEDCGIAYHTVRIVSLFKQLEDINIDVIRLPVRDLRGTSSWQKALAHKFINETVERIKEYDYIILQVEPGLYGSDVFSRFKRLCKLIQAIDKGMIIVHSTASQGELPTLVYAIGVLFKGNIRPIRSRIRSIFESFVADKFWKIANLKNLGILTLNERDRYYLQGKYNFSKIQTYPICYFSDQEISNIKDKTNRDDFCKKFNIPSNKILIGLFGFIGAYKGHLTAIKSLEFLPDNYHLVVVGAEHPHGLPVDVPMSATMQKILTFSTCNYDSLINSCNENAYKLQNLEDREVALIPNKILNDRIHFIGNVSDDEMPKMYAVIDIAIHPYLNTSIPQSGSGPATFAIEIGVPALYSNAGVFRELNKFFPYMEMFNIGNYLELSNKIINIKALLPNKEAVNAARQKVNPKTMLRTYLSLMGYHN